MQKIKLTHTKQITIPALHTYLIKQNQHICPTIHIQLLSGCAQIYGLSLMKHYPHIYSIPCCLPIFSWQGCRLFVSWKQQEGIRLSDEEWCDLSQFHSQDHPMIKYLQLHYQLTSLRKASLIQAKEGPRLAIVGGENVATQMVAKLMLNYAGKLNMRPIFIDLDLENSIFIDGTLGALVFQYKICQDFFDRPDKLSFFYGNRKIKKKSFLKQITLVAETVNKKIQKQLKSFKQKGTDLQCPSFASGVIIHCPRILQKQEKKSQKQLIYQILKIFKVSHVLSVDDSQIPLYLSKQMPLIQKQNLAKLQGCSNFCQLGKPVLTKIQRYFVPQVTKTLTININLIHLYQFIQPNEQSRSYYCREISIKDQPIAKSTIAVLFGDNVLNQLMEDKADRVIKCSVKELAFIFRITQDQVVLHVLTDTFWQDNSNKLWMSMISQN